MPTPYIGQIVAYVPTMVERSGWAGDEYYPAILTQVKIAEGQKPRVNLQVFHPNGGMLVKIDAIFCLGEEVPTFGQAGVIS